MRRALHHILLIAALFLPGPVLAQQDDRGYLQALLEDSLSGVGREVRITGFAGFLSARATVEEITIADSEGIWLTITNAALQWDRGAILSGRLEIAELSAAEITLARLPVAASSTVQPEAAGFSLPELPVSVNIGQIAAQKVMLGAPVLGEAAVLRLQGSAELTAALGRAALEIVRLDGSGDSLIFSGSYIKETRELALSLALSEAENGIVAGLINLPGLPAIDLAVAGTGPVDDFSTEISLATDGETRLSGQVVLAKAELAGDTARYFSADLGGDIASLFLPEYQSFFGPDIRLLLRGNRAEDGRLAIDGLTLTTEAMRLSGQMALSPSGWPERFLLEGGIAALDGAPVLLPLPGEETRIEAVVLRLGYNRREGDSWSGVFDLKGVQRQDMAIERARLDAKGRFPASGGVSGDVSFAVQGMAPQNPDLAAAIGPVLDGNARFNWREGTPLNLEISATAGPALGFVASGNVSGLQDEWNLLLAGNATLDASDIARFRGVAGMPLAGGVRLSLEGQAALGGSFEATVRGRGVDLAIGQPRLDPLMRGESTLALMVRRDEAGTSVEQFEITTPVLQASASGDLKTGASTARLSASLQDMGLVVPDFAGPVALEASASQSGEVWGVEVTGNGPLGAFMRASGQISGAGQRANLAINGSLPLVLANGLTRPNLLGGTAGFELVLNGPLRLSSLTGSINTGTARLTMPNLGLSLDPIAASVRLANGQAFVEASAPVSSGGRLGLSGPVALTSPYQANLSAQIDALGLSDPALFQTTVNGSASISGALLGGASIGADLSLGTTEVQVPSEVISSTPVLADIRHINEPAAVHTTRGRAGLVQQSAPESGRAYPIDIVLRAPSRIFVRGRGLDSELGGQIRLTGTTANIISQGRFNLIRGRLDILGKRLTLTEGYARLQGSFDPYIYLLAETRADAADVRITIEGQITEPVVSFTSRPELPEDEVLSLLLFGRDITKISALQALSLANAVNTLAGRGGGGIVNRLRASFNLDNLDVVVADDGTVGARLGRYISEDIYTDIAIGSDGESEINLNLSLSPSLNARGSLSSDGQTSLGVFFEKDY